MPPSLATVQRTLCRLAGIATLAALPAFAHEGAAHDTAAAASTPVEMTGRVDVITVRDRATGATRHFPVLALPDGRHVRLENAATAAAGSLLTVTGILQRQTLTAQALRSPAPGAAGAIKPKSAGRGEANGTLRMFHVDYPDGHSDYGFSLVPDEGRSNIVDLGTTLPIANGARAKISGPIDADGYIEADTIEVDAPVAGPTMSALTTATPAAVTTGYTVVPLQFPNNAVAPFTYGGTPSTIATIQANVFGAAPAKSVAEFYKEVSFGNQLLSGIVAADPVNGWYRATVARPTSCGTSAQLNAVLSTIEGQATALVGSSVLSSRPGILYISDSLPCGWSGLGYIGWSRAYTNGSSSLLVVGHELGHNFGLYHAGSVRCASGVTIAPSGCSVSEYGDPFVIMGNQSAGHFNAYQKDVLSYIAPSTVIDHAGGTATYTLGPIETAGQAQYAIRIPTSIANRTYWVEFRRPLGFDTAVPAAIGAQVRVSVPFENNGSFTGMYDDTQFLDMTPADASFSNGSLAVGSTFTDPATNVSIQVVAGTATELTVKVSTGGITSSSTTLGASANPSTQGQQVTFTASVTGTAPTGSVAFRDAGTNLTGCATVALVGSGDTRTATCAISTLATGAHSITAVYTGDAGNSGSTSATLTQTVKSASTTTVSSSQNPATAGSTVTFTATVNGTAPSGNVAFTADGTAIGGCAAVPLTGSGSPRIATCSTTALAAGSHAIVASYAGDSANAASASAALTQTVNTGATGTTTTLVSSLNPSNPGNSVTFTATVNGNLPTGNVAFNADGAAITGCSAIALAGSGNTRTAACITTALASGAHAITATYAGNAQNASSTSPTLTQTVTGGTPAAPTATSVVTSNNPSPQGAAVTFTATVTASPAVSGGTVAFTTEAGTVPGCGAVAIVAAGAQRTATCTTSVLMPAAYGVVASYSGDGSHLPSTSPMILQVIPPPAIGNSVQFASSAYAVNEAAGTVTLVVTRIGDVAAPATVNYATAGGSAAADIDFTSRAGTLSWAAHDASSRLVTVPIVDDALGESSETFTVTLASPAGATLGANATTTVTIYDSENSTLAMPGTATIVQNPYGTMSVTGATLSGNLITGLARSATIRLGSTPGTTGSFARLDFQGFDIGAGNTLVIQSGAAGQTVYLHNAGASVAAITGALVVQGANGAPPPAVVIESEPGLTVNAAGSIAAPGGLVVDTLGTPATTGGNVQNQGVIDGGATLRIDAAKVNGGGRFVGNAIAFATFGNLNNPVNGTHYLANGLQLYPSAGTTVALAVSGFGLAPQFMNLTVNGNATYAMPSLWPASSTMPATNRPVLAGQSRAAGVPDPAFGGGSIIVQATGNLTLDGGASADLVFPGGIAIKAGGTLDTRGTAIDNAWTTSGQAFQGVFLEAAQIVDSSAAAALEIRTNNKNWANFGVRPAPPVSTWTLQAQPNGAQAFVPAAAVAPHLNLYSIETEAGAAGQCWTCLVNTQVVDLSAP